jgi:hypothetical protein
VASTATPPGWSKPLNGSTVCELAIGLAVVLLSEAFEPVGLAVVLTRGVSGRPQALVVMEIIATAAAILRHM